MTFIAISPNVIVNAERISAIYKTKTSDGKDIIALDVDGKTHIVEYDFPDFYRRLIKSGVDLTEQFFAG
jgi:hypothetical protein